MFRPSGPSKNSARCQPIPKSLERQIRQALADKISGNQVGVWLLLPEHLRLGTWDLMRSWSGGPPERVEPRLALHLVNEAAMCLCSYRSGRTLSQKGFELANGLPFVPTDLAIHDLLEAHTLEQAQRLQIALGKLRRAGKHFQGTLLALDPHRMTSYSKRQMRRHRFSSQDKPSKMAQTRDRAKGKAIKSSRTGDGVFQNENCWQAVERSERQLPAVHYHHYHLRRRTL